VQNLRLPERFQRLQEEQQADAMIALQQVDEAQRQAVLDEWAARCHSSTVRNPAGYLFGIIQKAIRGEFKAWASEGGPSPSPSPSPSASTPRTAASAPSPSASREADPEVARAYLERLRSMMRDP
jgi:hypothetical protein